MTPEHDSTPAARPPDPAHPLDEAEGMGQTSLIARSAVGGVLMGLANLVPGISGGTMLLAAGIYPTFINAIAEVTTLRLKVRPLLVLGTIGVSALLAILLLAGTMKALVIEQRWVMYSLFIGLTLGGLPLVWRMARPANFSVAVGALAAFVLMGWMSFGTSAPGSDNARFALLVLSGLAGASAMILPGVSGGYLLLLLGQYEPILGGIDTLKRGLLGGSTSAGPDPTLILEAMQIVIPVGLGVLVGIIGVSNLVRWLLNRYEKLTLGLLLGLLLGSVVGLYPFQAPVPPEPGFVHRGTALMAEEIGEVDPADWPLRSFRPSPSQGAAALGLIAGGLLSTLAVDRIGRRRPHKRIP